MSFAWPWALLALLAVPLILAVARWSRRRRRRVTVRVTSAALVRRALPGRTAWHRRIPAALLVAGIAVLGVGTARPQESRAVSSSASTIMLALDVSGSMCSTDVSPNRLTAAENAATTFIKAQPGGARIGLVAFAGVAGLLVPPTRDTSQLLSAVQGLTTSRGTAIGQAILTSLDAIAAIDPSVAPTGTTPKVTPTAGYAAETIVLLTDGANNQGVDPQTAAKAAAARRVRVYTIGFGTTTPAPLVCSSAQAGDSGFGGGGFGGGGFGGGGFGGRGENALIADDGALKQVAASTGGQFYVAKSASQLQSVLAKLPRTITVAHRKVDLAALFAGIGGALIVAALALSLWWNRVRSMPGAVRATAQSH